MYPGAWEECFQMYLLCSDTLLNTAGRLLSELHADVPTRTGSGCNSAFTDVPGYTLQDTAGRLLGAACRCARARRFGDLKPGEPYVLGRAEMEAAYAREQNGARQDVWVTVQHGNVSNGSFLVRNKLHAMFHVFEL